MRVNGEGVGEVGVPPNMTQVRREGKLGECVPSGRFRKTEGDLSEEACLRELVSLSSPNIP